MLPDTSYMKKARSIFCVWALACVFLAACNQEKEALVILSGNTMGTTYHITYGATRADNADSVQILVDSLLVVVNESMSTYISTSLISQINTASDTSLWIPVDPHFRTVFERSTLIYAETGGAFNPAVGPLVAAWGFGPNKMDLLPDSTALDSIRALVDLANFVFDPAVPAIRKRNPGASLDFSAIAKGYGVDVIGQFFESRGATNYFVEIGGEIRARGEHPSVRPWRMGIEKPAGNQLDSQETEEVIELGSAAMATSGNYRNFYVKDGRKYVHTIDPSSGYPKESSLLSVSVMAPDCMTADAYATSLMVLGAERGMSLIEAHNDLEALFIVSAEDGAYTTLRSSGFPAEVSK